MISKLLDNSIGWKASRITLDLAFGHHQRRTSQLRHWGLLSDDPSVIDIGCGIGQYSGITEGPYLGIDLNERYIRHAGQRVQRPNARFRCGDARTLGDEGAKYDLVLMVDFLHHLPAADVVRLLRTTTRLTDRHVVSFEPIVEQTHPVGDWIVKHDRGDYMRPREELYRLFAEAGLSIIEAQPLSLGPIDTTAILAQPGVRC
jgi:2-polyprenyl-3-methyl-5-hydroxy-6-metoxy-1,4-benzoquinol methylase